MPEFYNSPGIAGYIRIEDQKTAGTDGGTFTGGGTYRTRTLNTLATDVNGDVVTLSSNQITLTAGTYYCFITCPANFVDRHKARLRNVTDSVTLLVGTSEIAESTGGQADSNSTIRGRFTIAASKALEVQHACNTTHAKGFGFESNFTEIEVYTVAEFWRIA